MRILGRVSGVDAVNLGGLEDHFGTDFSGAQAGRGIGGEKRVAGSGPEDDDPALFQMSHRPPANVRFGNRLHFDGRLHAGDHPLLFEGVLHRHAVHHRGQHPHVVGAGPIHPGG